MRLIRHFIKFLMMALATCVLFGAFPAFAKPVIVVDAAHGGSDPGVKAGSEVEKEWNYRFAQALQKALESEGFEVVQIRKKDETLKTERRAEMTNTAQAAAVIVIHADREWSGNFSGPMVIVEPPTQSGETGDVPRWGAITPAQFRASLKLGRAIALALGLGTELSSLSDSRGLAGETTSPASRLFCLPHESLRYLSPPAVVVTPLFLSSHSDIRKFSNDSAVSEFAARVAEGLANYLQ